MRILRIVLLCWGFLLITAAVTGPAAALQNRAPSDGELENRVSKLERKFEAFDRKAPGAGLALFGIASLCALRAQNTRRSGVLWFFLGLFFSGITLLVMLYKNSNDIDTRIADAQTSG